MGFVKCITALNQGGWHAEVGQMFDDAHQYVVSYPSYFSDPSDAQFTGSVTHGTAADAVAIKGRYLTGVLAVTVPSITIITGSDVGTVTVDISSDPLTFAAAVGDHVEAIPQEALPTNCVLIGAHVLAADSIAVNFGGVGNVTGAAKNFKFLITDLT